MWKILDYSQLSRQSVADLTKRHTDPDGSIEDTVQGILARVGSEGDAALQDFSRRFDRVDVPRFFLEKAEIEALAAQIGRAEQRALEIAFSSIHRFHSVQTKRERKVETMQGVVCWRELRPIEKVGLYIPGGSAVLPSTLLMLGVPARIAGCKEMVVCTPPQADGQINPAVAYCLQLLQLDRVYLVGGAQAIAAMAFGTESIPKVDKIFGPGNQYVTKAKSLVQSRSLVAIDMPAGPSEVLIIADERANPRYLAADLLAQAEHGPDSQAILVSTDGNMLERVRAELKRQLADLPRKEIAERALEGSYGLLVPTLEQAMDFSNAYAPEHLILAVDDFQRLVPRILHAGSVFLGPLSAESMGDYASGTNHTLPTGGYARAYSGVSVDSFVKKITFQQINETGLQYLGPTVETLAALEGLEAHKRAVSVRLADVL